METEIEFLDELLWIIENPATEDEPKTKLNNLANEIVERIELLTNEEEQ